MISLTVISHIFTKPYKKSVESANNFLGSEIVFAFWTFIFVHFAKVNSTSLKKT